jgi:hypothetical protein
VGMGRGCGERCPLRMCIKGHRCVSAFVSVSVSVCVCVCVCVCDWFVCVFVSVVSVFVPMPVPVCTCRILHRQVSRFPLSLAPFDGRFFLLLGALT